MRRSKYSRRRRKPGCFSKRRKTKSLPRLLKRMEMLDQLKSKHSIINWASNFIVLLFILLEDGADLC